MSAVEVQESEAPPPGYDEATADPSPPIQAGPSRLTLPRHGPSARHSDSDDPPRTAASRGRDSEPPLTQNPTQAAITYTFSPIDANSMLLLPPQTAADSRPLYHISWYEDFFRRGNMVTTVRRGGSADGDFVGMFDLKGGQKKGVVSLGMKRSFVSDACQCNAAGSRAIWRFSTAKLSATSPRYHWERNRTTNTMKCTIGGTTKIIAQSVSAGDDSVQRVDDYVDRLVIEPNGQTIQVMDEILLSFLVLQRLFVIQG
ncbi:hypothetical protein BXZ70DRAFT_118304 [Cristinia sonorae]|uniref:DUF6593 domain-containing protein n=1 Tax=Cristinia sonorae TaxID=1940300 RepID=A0A8K0XQF6_9AGAR|nr:hypothetical protein BXZ70DRAFT_118304 [Cristinia sonorae]